MKILIYNMWFMWLYGVFMTLIQAHLEELTVLGLIEAYFPWIIAVILIIMDSVCEK